MTRFRLVSAAAGLALAGCVSVQQPTPTPTGIAAIDARTAPIEQKIASACVWSGLFKFVDARAANAVPSAKLGIDIVNAGVDQVCARPDLFAQDAATAEWVWSNLKGAIKRHVD